MISAATVALFIYQLRHFNVDTDLIRYLPQNDPVLSDARYVIERLPVQDRVVINVSHQKIDRDVLADGAAHIEKALKQSGLFKSVGIEDMEQTFPALMSYISGNLPVMFDEKELDEKIKPLLSREQIKTSLAERLQDLQGLDGIGQAEFLSHDPLGIKNIAMSRLSGLVPSKNASIYRGYLMSSDGKNLLVIAELSASGTDTKTSVLINSLINKTGAELNKIYAPIGYSFKLDAVGAYRAALDNQEITKRDTERAVVISTVVIILLLLLGFPRPLIGLLALLPSLAGTMMAFIVYSFMHRTITALAVGFGGAIISFTVDYGITYLLFLDRPHKTYGLKATREVWSLGLLAMLTTAISFAFLNFSGFPALAQIGEFAALGVVFTYICVHAFFPVMFPQMKPAKGNGILPMKALAARLISSNGRIRFYAVIIFGVVMLFFARPEFNMDLNSMNTTSKETLASENLVKRLWGDIYSRVYLMVEGSTVNDLQSKGDILTPMLEKDAADGSISSAFLPSMIFPGKDRMQERLGAWRKFWSPARTKELKKNINAASQELGFAPDAFSRFIAMVEKPNYKPAGIPEDFYSLLGITKKRDNTGYLQFSMLTASGAYNADNFYSRYSGTGLVKTFDPSLFAQRLGKMLMSGFIKMAVIVGIITVLVAMLYLFDLQLTAIAMAPTIFALVSTLGTMKILGQPLGIPAIIVSVVVIGMGTDYALYLVRAYQRYMDENNSSLRLVHMSVILSFATTFAGFAVLAFSEHSVLKSAGLCLTLGIGYSFLGAVCIVPPMLKRVFAAGEFSTGSVEPGTRSHSSRVMARYRHMEAYPRLFARFKILLDPMFPDIADLAGSPEKIIDIGCGYGVPLAWLLEIYPDASVHAFEPDKRRALIASHIIGSRGHVQTARAPMLPPLPGRYDTALMLDIIHYLSDDELADTLGWVRKRLSKKGRLVIRATVPTDKHFPWERLLENARLKLGSSGRPSFRSPAAIGEILSAAGFQLISSKSSAAGREETWFVAKMV